jgi:hypothetical protein
MDEHLYDDLIESIRVVASHVEGIIDTEKCFIRKSGMKYHVDLRNCKSHYYSKGRASTSPYFKGYFTK